MHTLNMILEARVTERARTAGKKAGNDDSTKVSINQQVSGSKISS